MVHPMSNEQTPDPQAAIARVRRLMLITMIATIVAVAVVFVVIGYRLFHLQGSAPPPFTEITAKLPIGAKVLSTGISNDRIVVMLQVNGGIELLTYDPVTLKPLGRLQLVEPKP
jgi:hypothetical protein